MRKKLYIGVFVAAIVGIAVGGALFNRSGAQDANKKSDAKKVEGNLFDTLKKDLEAKKELPPVTLPPVPVTLPPLDLSEVKEEAKKKEPAPPIAPLPEPKPLTVQPPVIVNEKPMPEPPKQTLPPSEPKPLTNSPPKKDALTFPPLQPATPKPELTFPPVQPTQDPVKPVVPTQQKGELADISKAIVAGAGNLTRNRNSPWSLQVEMADGYTVVIATVNKKHEFKITCTNLELQTGKGTLRAGGNVLIHGEMINGSCGELTISLDDDRIALKGGAAVTIQKVTTTVSDTKPAAFELKGETLNLRISEIESGNLTQASWPSLPNSPRPIAVGSQAAGLPATADNSWSPYGKLVRTPNKVGPELRLEKSNGDLIAYILTNEGKSLDQYVGRTISVFGTRERMVGSQPVMRVTHIALP